MIDHDRDEQIGAVVRAVQAATKVWSADGFLDASRLAEAVGRVHRLADGLTAARAARPR